MHYFVVLSKQQIHLLSIHLKHLQYAQKTKALKGFDTFSSCHDLSFFFKNHLHLNVEPTHHMQTNPVQSLSNTFPATQ